jgi:hypothetical protein
MRTIIRTVAVAIALGGAALTVPGPAQAAKPHWTVSIHANKATVTAGKKAWFHGKVARAAAGKLVTLQERLAGSTAWKDQRDALVRRDGTYTTYDAPTVNRRHFYRVVMPASKNHRRGVSDKVVVDVFKWTTLTSIPAVNQDYLYPVTSVSFDGVTFPSSIEAYLYYDPPATQSIEFNLDHRCTRFRGTFGISDDSESGSQASVQASADGVPWYDHTFALGESQANSFTFTTPPLKVRFDTVSLVDGLDGLGAVGTPEVYCEG